MRRAVVEVDPATQASHKPSHKAPRVSLFNNASKAQADGRNDDVFQAPFIAPPIFSGSKFIFFAFVSRRLETSCVLFPFSDLNNVDRSLRQAKCR